MQCRDQLRHTEAEHQLSESGLRQGNLLKKLGCISEQCSQSMFTDQSC